jgi:hypothetical protein
MNMCVNWWVMSCVNLMLHWYGLWNYKYNKYFILLNYFVINYKLIIIYILFFPILPRELNEPSQAEVTM